MSILSNFGENLLSLMVEQNLNAPKLANILKTDRSNVTRYLRGERLPTFTNFINIINYFNISADVILGLKEFSNAKIFLKVENFNKRLLAVMKETKTTQYKLCKDLKVSGSSLYKWLTNESLPSVENLVKLSSFMGVSVDYLLGRLN
ncbi:MAG: helix-turn-helix transcriptional regulator [Clostridiales bacterium]|nr:helix-turn-helix transcriptional regulator [Clostridiales bacterium]